MKIYKYTLPVQGVIEMDLPVGAQLLTLQAQFDIPCLWALVTPDAEREIRHLRMYGTGHPIDHDPGQYIGSFHLHGGAVHLFEAVAPSSPPIEPAHPGVPAELALDAAEALDALGPMVDNSSRKLAYDLADRLKEAAR